MFQRTLAAQPGLQADREDVDLGFDIASVDICRSRSNALKGTVLNEDVRITEIGTHVMRELDGSARRQPNPMVIGD
jgi:hypothetical protein